MKFAYVKLWNIIALSSLQNTWDLNLESWFFLLFLFLSYGFYSMWKPFTGIFSKSICIHGFKHFNEKEPPFLIVVGILCQEWQ